MKGEISICVILLICGVVSTVQNSQCIFHNFNIQEKQDQDILLLQENINIVFGEPCHHSSLFPKQFQSRNSHDSQKINTNEEMLAYSGKFRQFKFNFEEAELKQLAYDVRDLYARDKVALFFISAYFIRACQLLQKQQTPAHQITKIIKRKIKSLMNITSIETFRKQKYGISSDLHFDPEYWKKVTESVEEITPKKYLLMPEQKDEQIENIIIEMVGLAKENYSFFEKFTTSICQQNNGFNQHINYKISQREERAKMKRIKQKLLRTHFKTHSDRCLNTFLNIGWKRTLQYEGFEELLNKVYGEISQIQFVVKDILRSKCMFKTVEQIRSAAEMIVQEVGKLKSLGIGIKLVEFQYRLHKITCDVLLVIQIGDLFCQMQLSLDFDEHLFEISHKMYEMSRSKLFSPIVQLFDWFLNIAPEFLYKIRTLVQERDEKLNKNSRQNYPETERMVKQYELLHNFFHLTSPYHHQTNISEVEFEKFVSYEINKLQRQILKPLETEL